MFENIPDAFVFGALIACGVLAIAAVVIILITPNIPWRDK